MKTIKLPIEYSNMEDLQILHEYTRLQNNVIRIAYNRFKENISEKEIRLFLKTVNLYSESITIDSWFIQSGIYKAKEMFNKDLEASKSSGIFPKRIFGSKNNLTKRSKGLISKEEFKNKRILPLLIIGEDSDAEKLTVLYKAFNRNYLIQDSLYETILNLGKMKVDPDATVSGEQLNAFLEKMSKYLKDVQLNIK